MSGKQMTTTAPQKMEQHVNEKHPDSRTKNEEKACQEEQGDATQKRGRVSCSLLCFQLTNLSDLRVFRHLRALHSLAAIHRKPLAELPLHVLAYSQLCRSRPVY